MIASLAFAAAALLALYFIGKRALQIQKNIVQGRPFVPEGTAQQRFWSMMRVAFGQSKMTARPVAFFLHLFVYAGFVIINIEILEIVFDGLFGTHRALASVIGHDAYYLFINVFEVLALLVLLACAVFIIRRNVLKLARFGGVEMTRWPRTDANIILTAEILLMLAFLTMNAADSVLMTAPDGLLIERGVEHYSGFDFGAWFWVSGWLTGLMPTKVGVLVFIERFCWWFHILGVMAFAVYVTYSKHLHIFLAFPNTYFSPQSPSGKASNMPAIQREVNLMMNPAAVAPPADASPARFGAKDVSDLSRKQLLEAYTCTECGRCASVCPAQQTGKLLSPRKIMMDTRDRLDELGKLGQAAAEKTLLHHYISPEELWACTTCNACTQACPVNINPLGIILDLRRFLVMEEASAPSELAGMFTNVENNGAPWQFSAADRAQWTAE